MAVSRDAVRRRWRLVQRIADQIAALQSLPLLELPHREWRWLVESHRRLQHVQRRGWQAALPVCQADLLHRLRSLLRQLDSLHNAAESLSVSPPVASERDLLLDLEGLEGEFSEVGFDLRARTVWVVTEPIVLDHIDFGPFRIVLHIAQLGRSKPYDVVPQDPNPSGEDTQVVHPHVRSNDLCEGQGRAALQRALSQGQLYEFFLGVRQILATYNAGSAYVPLSRWRGVRCRDCGGSSDEDSVMGCQRCEADLCLDCAESCEACDGTCCAGCRETCPDCDRPVCSACLEDCADCGETFCRQCLTDGRCPACGEVPDDPEPDEEDSDAGSLPDAAPQDEASQPASTASGPEVHTLCLEQAAVPG
jgi:hypothetical protein